MSVPVTILLGFVTLRLCLLPPVLANGAVDCVSDSSAQSTLQFARNFMTAPDAFVAEERGVFDLPQLREAQVGIVTDRALCERAAEAYAHRFGPDASLDVKPERLVVVKAGDYYFVENMSPGESGEVHDENFWEIQLFTGQWHPIVSFGQGS